MKLSERMQIRNEGMLMAYKVAKDGGVEALEKEIQFRNLTGVSLNIPRKEIEEATANINLRATEVAITISLVTLLEEFCFSKFQALKFKDTFDRKVQDILNDEVTLADYLKRIRGELNIDLVVRD